MLLSLTAHADPPACVAYDGSQGRCLTEAAIRLADADSAQLPHVLAELRVAEQRLVVALGDALVLARALDVQSALVTQLRADVVSARPWLSGWAYVLIGGALGVAGTLLVALAL